jgi:hypothetical protein
MEQGSRTKLGAALVVASVFASGVLIGYAVHDGGAIIPLAAETASATERAPLPEGQRYVPVYHSMNPTPDQLARIETIMVAHRERMNRLHEDFDVAREAYQSSYDALILETRDAIAAIFPEERQAEYRRRLEEYDLDRAEARAKRGRRQ